MDTEDSITPRYVSPWLIHWTSREGGAAKGLCNLNAIISTQRLKLSDLPIVRLDFRSSAKVRMVCFTDVPLIFSEEHCSRYGQFGIAFKKRKLILYGAQPVFYLALGCRENVKRIMEFILDPPQGCNIPPAMLKSLGEHFCYMQEFSEDGFDSQDAHYYEREWRISEPSLVPENLWAQKPSNLAVRTAGYPDYWGRRIAKDGEDFFVFEDDDVAFVVCPREHASSLQNPKGYDVRLFENIVEER